MTEKNLENVSHEEAVSALKCTSDRVVLIVAKGEAPLAPMQLNSGNIAAVIQPVPSLLQQQQTAPQLLSQSAANLTTYQQPGIGKSLFPMFWNTLCWLFFSFFLQHLWTSVELMTRLRSPALSKSPLRGPWAKKILPGELRIWSSNKLSGTSHKLKRVRVSRNVLIVTTAAASRG